MAPNDFNPQHDANSEADSLSATGMFLRAFDSAATPPAEPAPTPPASAATLFAAPEAPPPPAAKAGGPGEFTQMFQSLEPRQAPAPLPPSPPAPSSPIQSYPVQSFSVPPSAPAAPAPAARVEPQNAPGPGEFTRIFVSGSVPALEHPAKTVLETPPSPAPAPAPARMKGFSSPGVSDSASAEGSFTQFFKAAPASPAPAPPVQSFTPAAPLPPTPVQDKPWQPESNLSLRVESRPAPSYSEPSEPSSATGMLSSMASPSASTPRTSSPDPWQPAPAAYRPEPRSEPLPSFTPAPPSEPSPAEAGGVTRLIQRLSQVTPQAPQETYVPPPPPPPAPFQVSAPAPSAPSSGPGEFTRMISGEALRAAAGSPASLPPAPAPAPPPSPAVSFAPPSFAPPAFTPPAAPQSPAFQMPAAPMPQAAPPPLPQFQAPQFAAPQPAAPPAIAAAPAKPDSLVRILLIANLFLTVLVLVVVLFAMKAK